MKYYIVDAFADALFAGNPAGVCVLEKPLDSLVMQNIAAENNLAETAFVVRNGKDYDLRWFTPEVEIDLCGHATLASGFIISNYVDKDIKTMNFHTMSGILSVTRKGDLYEMDFPARAPEKIDIPELVKEALGVTILEAHLSRDLVVLVDSEEVVKQVKPNLALLEQIPDCFAIVVTAKGDEVDFVSRFFAPGAGIAEDPVTGSAHSTLIPFWAERLGKNEMIAKQLSKRGGTLYCENCGERVKMAGKAALYLTGNIHL